jgi:L-ascorbate metabolism protein UlaG (beta-lactamase superfamily)
MMTNPIGTTKRNALGKVICLGSSSEGNAYFVEINRKGYPNPYKLLIECGFQTSELSRRLLNSGLSLNDINGVLVTHEHHDHSQGVPKLLEFGKKVFAPLSVYEHYGVVDKIKNENVITANAVKRIADGIDVLGFELEHKNDDGSKTYNLGYIIKCECDYGLHTILFVTDTQYIRFNLFDWKFNTIFIEANNITRNIIFSLKEAQANGDRLKEMHYDRVLHSHMLVENTIKTLIGTDGKNGFDLSETNVIFLIHLTASGLVNPFEIKTKVQEALAKSGAIRTIIKDNKKYVLPKVFVFKKNGEMI